MKSLMLKALARSIGPESKSISQTLLLFFLIILSPVKLETSVGEEWLSPFQILSPPSLNQSTFMLG